MFVADLYRDALMAYPVADSYVVASGIGSIAGGRFHRAAWRRAMSVNTWGEIPTTLLSSIDPKDTIAHNPNYPAVAPWLRTTGAPYLTNKGTNDGVMTAYCGGAFDDVTGTFWLPLGGGHSDYGGNESYKIPLNVDSPSWSMVRPPSGSTTLIAGGLPAGSTPLVNSYVLDDGKESTGIYADGQPRATHSYGKHVHVPGLGMVMALHGGGFTNATPSPKFVWWLNEVTNEWEWKSTATSSVVTSSNSSYATYDSTRGCIYLQVDGTAPLIRLDVTNWTYSNVSSNTIGSTGYTSNIYIKEYDVCFQACSYWTNKFCIKDIATGLIHQPMTTGTAQTIGGETGQCWVPWIGMVFVIGKALWSLTPTGNPRTDPWTWAQLAATNASLPTDTSSAGPWTKVGYSKKLGGIYRFTNASSKPWFYATE